MASQPLTGVNQQPLVFAQITNGVSSPDTIKARIVTSSREVDIKSNMFLHLFYSKPYIQDRGYNHTVDQAYGFQVKSDPDVRAFNEDIKAQNELDVGDMKSEIISERELLTLSELKTWEFKPSVRVSDFFANSLGVPIDCWTPCSRIAIARELEAADLIKYELQCGAGESDACAMSAGELARSLHAGDQLSFGDIITGDCVEDLAGHVQLSVLFVNENPDIQPLDFRLRLRILPCRCPPILVKVPKGDGSQFDAYRVNLIPVMDNNGEDTGSVTYSLDYNKVTKEEALCLGYFFDSDVTPENQTFDKLNYPVRYSIEEVFGTNKNDDNNYDHREEGKYLINYPATKSLAGNKLFNLSELNVSMGLSGGTESWEFAFGTSVQPFVDLNSATFRNAVIKINETTSWKIVSADDSVVVEGQSSDDIAMNADGDGFIITATVGNNGPVGKSAVVGKRFLYSYNEHQDSADQTVAAGVDVELFDFISEGGLTYELTEE